jgi:hypothetical protein
VNIFESKSVSSYSRAAPPTVDVHISWILPPSKLLQVVED